MLVEDLKEEEQFTIPFDEDMNLILGSYIDKKDMYLAYIDYLEKNEINYFYKKMKLEVVPKQYLQLYYDFSKYYKENYDAEVNQKLDNIVKEIEEIKEYLNLDEEENMATYFNKTSRLNTAEFELNKIRKLTK